VADSAASFNSLAEALRDRYRFERELGRGGMATVYLARDLRHERLVAVKVLRSDLSATLGASRFLREIQFTARLQHANILPLFDSGEAHGQLWYTMPFVEGGTLRERLRAQGQLPVEEALGITRQVLAALACAHEYGIVHRDIKPENILLSHGGALVSDFGIAHAISAVGAERLTETGIAIGTAAYMSPEQSTADHRLDGRSDLYSLGCVLYEMLTGEPPYGGPSAQVIIAKRLSEPIPHLRTMRETISPSLERVVTKALAKAPADRFATADHFASALSASGAATVPSRITVAQLGHRRLYWAGAALALAAALGAVGVRSWQGREPGAAVDPNVIAVLPFRVISRDSADNYLREASVDLVNAQLAGDGLPRAVDTRTALSRWRRAVQADGGELTTARALQLAQGLGAGQLFLGEFVITASQTTVSGRLLRVPAGEVVAEHSEVVRAGEVDELALVERLLGRMMAMTAGEGAGRLPHLSDSIAAVKAYLAGRRAYDRSEVAAAITQYRRALEIDSTFALPAYWLAIASNWPSSGDLVAEAGRRAWSSRDHLDGRDRAQLAAEWSVGPNYPEPYTTSQLIEAAERAAQVSPDRPEALHRLGTQLLQYGAAASIDGWLRGGVVALDSAIRLDSTFGDALWMRLNASLLSGNPGDVRRFASLYFRNSPAGDMNDATRWMVAHALKDSAAIAAARARSPQSSPAGLEYIIGMSAMAGVPLDDLEPAITAPSTGLTPCSRLRLLLIVGALRGQVSGAIARADSMSRIEGCAVGATMITLALAEPGYQRVAAEYARQMHESTQRAGPADTLPDYASQICFAELWRVSRGDARGTRRAIERIQRLVRNLDPAALPRVGRLGVCPMLLQTQAEAPPPRSPPEPALVRLYSFMAQGNGLELPGNLANLMLARWLGERGDVTSALLVARSRVYTINTEFSMLVPAYLREEGRLAALAGDTAGAVRAYQHYLRLRDQPDPGPTADQVRAVKAHLSELLRKPA
jgi:hypothetical protein